MVVDDTKNHQQDVISNIFERIFNCKETKSFAIVSKKLFKVASFHLRRLDNTLPDLLYDLLIASLKMELFEYRERLTNNHMKLIADSCLNIRSLMLSIEQNLDHEAGKLEFNDVVLQEVANDCIHLVYVNLCGRLRFTEIGITSLVRSCKRLRTSELIDCVHVTDKALEIIAKATCLNALHLQRCNLITDLGLKSSANGDFKHCLDTLYLDTSNRITDNGIIHLKNLVTLYRSSFLMCGVKSSTMGLWPYVSF